MYKVVLGVFLAAAVLAARPLPSKVITVTVSNSWKVTGSIVVSESAPSDPQLFDDAQDVLASITSANNFARLCSLGMTTVSTTN